MSALPLKGYQERCLEELAAYLRLAVQMNDVDTPFYIRAKRAYQRVEQVPNPPYVCLRVPTGGGKTLMACHALSVVAQNLQAQDRCAVLWLVPTNTIKDQTLTALKDVQHPYRQALDSTLDGRVRAVNIEEAQYLPRAVFDGETVIIVTTLANPRIGDTDNRKMYEQNGNLTSHFESLPPEITAQLEPYEGTDKPIPSLANAIFLRKPIVIMDEAHNAGTKLSFETLARFDPSCVLEFTATPAARSNVLHRVSASELKSEGMIKLPIRLETCPRWQESLQAAINQRDALEQAAKEEAASGGPYLRPIALVQAQKRNEDLPVDTVYNCLKNDLGIPEAQIAIETGEQQDLKKFPSLFDQSCPVRYIITVDKLREGWDCSFAYVLCSVRNIGSKTAVEQILGRVLRMPNATRRTHDDLNRAYAFVTETTAGAAESLDVITQALQGNGFTPEEAAQAVAGILPGTDGKWGGMFAQTQARVAPADRGDLFTVPQLCLWLDGELETLDDVAYLQGQWQLADYPAELTAEEYSAVGPDSRAYEIDVDEKDAVKTRFISNLQRHLAIVVPNDITTRDKLVMWLDPRVRQPDVVQMQLVVFLDRLVGYLTDARHIGIEDLARDRVRLRDAVLKKINKYRADAATKGIQAILAGLPDAPRAEVSAERVFTYPSDYPVGETYQGHREFPKHYYGPVAAMNHEEEECAEVIDSLPSVRHWVRNIEHRPDASFWLQTTSDRFYPDFVAQLEDGRVMSVEYKGAHLATNEDTREKELLGNMWAEKSDGKCIFLMVTHEDYAARIREAAG